jgi:hypothetical protein
MKCESVTCDVRGRTLLYNRSYEWQGVFGPGSTLYLGRLGLEQFVTGEDLTGGFKLNSTAAPVNFDGEITTGEKTQCRCSLDIGFEVGLNRKSREVVVHSRRTGSRSFGLVPMEDSSGEKPTPMPPRPSALKFELLAKCSVRCASQSVYQADSIDH